MSQAQATKTLRQLLEYRPGVSLWFNTTQRLFNQIAAFYWQVLDAHPAVLDLPAKEALTALERLTHTTAANPQPVMPLSCVATQLPAYFRRAAIHAALGSMHSFQTQRAQWQQAKEKAERKGKTCRVRPPVPPRTWNRSVTFYAGMWKQATNGRITLKLYDGQAWRWARFRVQGPPPLAPWNQGSPQAVRHGMRWWLHVPLSRTFPHPQKAAVQLAADLPPLLCSVDLNINDALAVATVQRVDGTVVASRFFRGGDELHGRRKSLLGRIARNRRRTGIIAEGEQDNVELWTTIRHLDEGTAHRLSRRIVDFAQAEGASLLVFEHLGTFRPERGKYSRRANAKRSFWLRGMIFRFSRYKAWNVGIVTCRVNPKKTSRQCARCGAAVVRYGPGEPHEGYRPGAPLVWCPKCRKQVNADHNASRNIGQRLVARCQKTHEEKPPTVLARGQAPKEAGVVCSMMPQGLEQATGTAPPDGIRRLLRGSSSCSDGALLRSTRTHECPKNLPEIIPRGVSL
jgi:transposase